MKKIIVILVLMLILLLPMAACNGLKSNVSVKNLDIEDFEWSVEGKYINGQDVYTMTLINNSKYDVITVEMYYGVKKGVSASELYAFSDFMEEHEEWLEDESEENITLVGVSEKLVRKGETLEDIIMYIGMETSYWDETPNEKQFELMEPSRIQLGIVGKDMRLYNAHYDFQNERWSVEKDSLELNSWPDNEMGKKLTEPNCDYYLVTSDEESEEVDFVVFGVDQNFFEKYIDVVKEDGFTVDAPEEYETYYSAENKEGNDIQASYNAKKETVFVYTHLNE